MAPTGGRLRNILFCCLLIVLQAFSNCSPYRKYHIGSDKVCSFIKKQTVKVEPPEKGVVVIEERTFDRWSGVREFHCRFKVERRDEGYLFVVINNLYFRRNQLTGECDDYIEFTGSDKKKSGKICGHVNAMKHIYGNAFSTSQSLSPVAYMDEEGEISVEIFVASMPLKSYLEELSLKLVFTSAVSCNGDAFECGENKCIPENYRSDDLVNCPFETCLDEAECAFGDLDGGHSLPPKSGLGTKVTLGAVATVLLAFVLFLTIIWLLRRCHKACWSPSRQRVPASVAETGGMAERLGCDRGNSSHVHTSPAAGYPADQFSTPSPLVDTEFSPSAPPPHLDKDLPPSYESLFPSR